MAEETTNKATAEEVKQDQPIFINPVTRTIISGQNAEDRNAQVMERRRIQATMRAFSGGTITGMAVRNPDNFVIGDIPNRIQRITTRY